MKRKPPWSRIPSCTNEEIEKLESRLKRYRSPHDKTQTLRLKALTLLSQNDPGMAEFAEQILRFAISRPELDNGNSEIGLCHGMLGGLLEKKKRWSEAIFHRREEKRRSGTPGTGLSLANVLLESDIAQYAQEVAKILDEVLENRNLQLLFREARLRYSFLRGRLAEYERDEKAAQHWRDAMQLELSKAPIDSFNRKPMDLPELTSEQAAFMTRLTSEPRGFEP